MTPTLPGTLKHAIAVAIAGRYRHIAALTGRHEKHIYRWTNPTEQIVPNIEQVMLIDAEAQRHGLGTPITRHLSRVLAKLAKEEGIEPEPREHDELLLDVIASIGNLAHETSLARNPESEDGESFSPREVRAMLNHANELRELTDELTTNLERMIPQLRNLQK